MSKTKYMFRQDFFRITNLNDSVKIYEFLPDVASDTPYGTNFEWWVSEKVGNDFINCGRYNISFELNKTQISLLSKANKKVLNSKKHEWHEIFKNIFPIKDERNAIAKLKGIDFASDYYYKYNDLLEFFYNHNEDKKNVNLLVLGHNVNMPVSCLKSDFAALTEKRYLYIVDSIYAGKKGVCVTSGIPLMTLLNYYKEKEKCFISTYRTFDGNEPFWVNWLCRE